MPKSKQRTYTGEVLKGSKRATALGFPTVNIHFNDLLISGIYIAEVTLDGRKYAAAVYADQNRRLLESYILDFLDFEKELYRKTISVTLLQKIRESEAFKDDEALKATITKDVEAVREYLNKHQEPDI